MQSLMNTTRLFWLGLALFGGLLACDSKGQRKESSRVSVSSVSEVQLSQRVEGVSLAGLSVWISGGEGVDYRTYQTMTRVQAEGAQALTRSVNSSVAAFPQANGIVLNYPGLAFHPVEGFERLSFSTPLPAGAKVEVFDGQRRLAVSQP